MRGSAFLGLSLLTGACTDPARNPNFAPDPDPRWADESIVQSDVAPPPISGGTLLVSRDGRTAFASDPDRDLVWAVDLGDPVDGAPPAVRFATALEPGDEPGRLAEDARGWIHVALRSGGAVASFDPGFAQDVRRTSVCPEPRGIAYDMATDLLHVACTSGELVSLGAADGVEVRRLQLARDLRDVLVEGDGLLVSRFKSAELMSVNADGEVLGSDPHGHPSHGVRAPAYFDDGSRIFEPAVAWRTIPLPGGGALMAHQRATSQSLPTGPGAYYGSTCVSTGVVHSTLAFFRETWNPGPVQVIPAAPVAVDIALSQDGTTFALAVAGFDSVIVSRTDMLLVEGAAASTCELPGTTLDVPGEPIAVAYVGDHLIVQARDPARILVFDGTTPRGEAVFDVAAQSDTGHRTFHHAVDPTTLACASCHPEGREDGRVWNFDIGPRRTQTLTGGILRGLPLHWSGELATFAALMDEVFVARMLADPPSPARIGAVATWLDTLPAPRAAPAQDAEAVARGRGIFEGAGTGCASCHSGERLTNDLSVDVGTGGAFQVPSLLGVAAREPLLHDGCAPTLRDRFDEDCGEVDRHGVVSHLDDAQIGDLVAYLETL